MNQDQRALKAHEDFKAGRISRAERDKIVAELHAERQFQGPTRKTPPAPTGPVCYVPKTQATLAVERSHGQAGAANAKHVSPEEQERREAARLEREREARKAKRIAQEVAEGKAPKPPKDKTLRYSFCLAGSMLPREAEDRDEACAHIVKTLLGDDSYWYAKVESGAFLVVWTEHQDRHLTWREGKVYWYASAEVARQQGVKAIADGEAVDVKVSDRLMRTEAIQFARPPARDEVIPSRKRGPVCTRPDYDNYRGGVWMRCKNDRASFSAG